MIRRASRAVLDLLLRPWGAGHAGKSARVALPRRLRGRSRMRLGAGTRVGAHAWLEAVTRYGGEVFHPRIEIGDDVSIGRYFTLTATRCVTIGDGCLFSEGVYMSDTAHAAGGFDPRPVAQRPLRFKGEVHIGARCFIGYRACILPGVTLGEGCVVGAHAVVTRSFGPGCVLAGVPARLVRTIAGP